MGKCLRAGILTVLIQGYLALYSVVCSKFLLKAKVLTRVREREELVLNIKDYWRWYSLLFVCFFTSLIVKLSCTTCYLLNPTLGPLLTPGKALGV